MNVVADESVDKQIVQRLRADGHSVQFIAEVDPGIDDEPVLLRAREGNAVLLTADKDFGELVFRQRLLHTGIVLIRLAGLQQERKADLVAWIFAQRGHELQAHLRCCRGKAATDQERAVIESGLARKRVCVGDRGRSSMKCNRSRKGDRLVIS